MSIRLANFTPVEPGWVVVQEEPTRSEPGHLVYEVWPMIGWAEYEEDPDGHGAVTFFRPVSIPEEFSCPETSHYEVFYSRALFREAQGGAVILGRAALLKAVSSTGA